MKDFNLTLDKNDLSFDQVKDLMKHNGTIAITESAKNDIEKCRTYLDKKIATSDQLFYGINTGFGFLQNVKIDKDQLQQLQKNLLQSHACGVGEEVPKEIVKLMMMLKIKSLSYGYS